VVACLPFDPRFAGSNPADDNGFLRATKILSTTSFAGGGGIKAVGRLWHVKDHCKYERDISKEKITVISCQDSLASLLDVSADNCQRAVGEESEMIIKSDEDAQ
jgi:hypothetical protein